MWRALAAAWVAWTPRHRLAAPRRATFLSEDPTYDAEDDPLDDSTERSFFSLANEKMTLSGDGASFADMRICDIASDYGFPVSYIADALVGFGISPPIRDGDKLADLVNGDQAYALLEALTSLDGNDIQAMYVDFTLDYAAYLLDVDVADLFAACNAKGFSLPHGLETQLRREQFDLIAKEVRDGAFERDAQRRRTPRDDDDDVDELSPGEFHLPTA